MNPMDLGGCLGRRCRIQFDGGPVGLVHSPETPASAEIERAMNVGRDTGLAEECHPLRQIYAYKVVSLETSKAFDGPSPDGSVVSLVKRFNPVGRQTLTGLETREECTVVAKHTVPRSHPDITGSIL
jgi:hypothetical protein